MSVERALRTAGEREKRKYHRVIQEILVSRSTLFRLNEFTLNFLEKQLKIEIFHKKRVKIEVKPRKYAKYMKKKIKICIKMS